MSVFWILYWLGFVGIPLVILLASKMFGSGSETSGTHIWVYKGTHNKVRNATNKEVWEHNHPGKSWDEYQQHQFIGCSIVLVIGFVVFLVWLAAEHFALPEDRPGLRIFWQVGAPILGGLSAGAFIGLQTLMDNYKFDLFKVLHILALVLMGVGVVGGLVLTFLEIDLPISYHWIWAAAGAPVVFLILDAIVGGVEKGQSKRKQEKAGEAGGKLYEFVVYMLKFVERVDLSHLDDIMSEAITKLRIGLLDSKIRNQEFFDLTEAIILDLVSGRQMSIPDEEIYRARESIIQAVQAFYFYSVKNFSCFKIHPKIEKALEKQN